MWSRNRITLSGLKRIYPHLIDTENSNNTIISHTSDLLKLLRGEIDAIIENKGMTLSSEDKILLRSLFVDGGVIGYSYNRLFNKLNIGEDLLSS